MPKIDWFKKKVESLLSCVILVIVLAFGFSFSVEEDEFGEKEMKQILAED